MRLAIGATLAALVLLAFSLPAIACSCVQYPNAREQLRNTDVVFIGRVVRTERDWLHWGRLNTTFEVEEALKGTVAARVRVTQTTDTTCGHVNFDRGSRTIVFANADGQALWTSTCSTPRFTEAEYRAALLPLYR